MSDEDEAQFVSRITDLEKDMVTWKQLVDSYEKINVQLLSEKPMVPWNLDNRILSGAIYRLMNNDNPDNMDFSDISAIILSFIIINNDSKMTSSTSFNHHDIFHEHKVFLGATGGIVRKQIIYKLVSAPNTDSIKDSIDDNNKFYPILSTDIPFENESQSSASDNRKSWMKSKMSKIGTRIRRNESDDRKSSSVSETLFAKCVCCFESIRASSGNKALRTLSHELSQRRRALKKMQQKNQINNLEEKVGGMEVFKADTEIAEKRAKMLSEAVARHSFVYYVCYATKNCDYSNLVQFWKVLCKENCLEAFDLFKHCQNFVDSGKSRKEYLVIETCDTSIGSSVRIGHCDEYCNTSEDSHDWKDVTDYSMW